MIPEQAIVEWRRDAPWEANSLVEQDLAISRALVEMWRCAPRTTARTCLMLDASQRRLLAMPPSPRDQRAPTRTRSLPPLPLSG